MRSLYLRGVPTLVQGTKETSGGVWEQKREPIKVKIYNHSSPLGTQQTRESQALGTFHYSRHRLLQEASHPWASPLRINSLSALSCGMSILALHLLPWLWAPSAQPPSPQLRQEFQGTSSKNETNPNKNSKTQKLFLSCPLPLCWQMKTNKKSKRPFVQALH